MDTLFRLVSLQSSASANSDQQQQSSYTTSGRTSTSSFSSSQPYFTPDPYQDHYLHLHHHHSFGHHHQPHHHFPLDAASAAAAADHHLHHQCSSNNAYHHVSMDEDFSSSSPSKPIDTAGASSTAPTPSGFAFPAAPDHLNLDFSPSQAAPGGSWAQQLLLECAHAVATRDSQRVQHLMWMLNELASPYGEADQRVAALFLQALFARQTDSGVRTHRTLAAAADRSASFESTRRIMLQFQELSPWVSFGHVAANGAILETFLDAGSPDRPPRFHILDLSNTFCTQWPTLLEALATRSADDTPHLSITTVVCVDPAVAAPAAAQRVMKEIGQRLEKFARLMGVPFRFRAVHHEGNLAELDLDELDVLDGGATTALAVNCVNALHSVSPGGRQRDAFVARLRRLNPRVVAIVEEEADMVADTGGVADDETAFLKVFGEALRFFTAYMESLDESFPKTSNERLALEKATGRAVLEVVACPASESAERREAAASWARRMRAAGFAPAAFSDDVADDVRSLLRKYRDGWSLRDAASEEAGVFLAWKEQPVVWASAWRP